MGTGPPVTASRYDTDVYLYLLVLPVRFCGFILPTMVGIICPGKGLYERAVNKLAS